MVNIQHGSPGIAGVKSIQYLSGVDGLPEGIDWKSLVAGAAVGYGLARGSKLVGLAAVAAGAYFLLRTKK